jgi:hypothetical protein
MSIRKIKNITQTTQTWEGRVLAPDEELDIIEANISEPASLDYFIQMVQQGKASLDVGNGVTYSIANGNVEGAERLLNGVVRLQRNGTTVIGQAETLNFTGNTSLTIGTSGNVDIDVIPNTLTMVTHQMTFIEDGTLKDEWLKLYDKGIPSNQTPGIIPWKSRLVGITFSNKKDNKDVEFKFYVTPEGGGDSPLTNMFVWSLNDVRVARKANFPIDVIFESGDKVAVFAKSTGNDPQDVILTMYFQGVEDADDTDGSENYSGEFKLTGGNGTTA